MIAVVRARHSDADVLVLDRSTEVFKDKFDRYGMSIDEILAAAELILSGRFVAPDGDRELA